MDRARGQLKQRRVSIATSAGASKERREGRKGNAYHGDRRYIDIGLSCGIAIGGGAEHEGTRTQEGITRDRAMKWQCRVSVQFSCGEERKERGEGRVTVPSSPSHEEGIRICYGAVAEHRTRKKSEPAAGRTVYAKGGVGCPSALRWLHASRLRHSRRSVLYAMYGCEGGRVSAYRKTTQRGKEERRTERGHVSYFSGSAGRRSRISSPVRTRFRWYLQC